MIKGVLVKKRIMLKILFSTYFYNNMAKFYVAYFVFFSIEILKDVLGPLDTLLDRIKKYSVLQVCLIITTFCT